MKRLVLIAAVAAAAAALPALAQQSKPKSKAEPVIDIKGFKLGMPEAEAAEVYRAMPEVTMAGAPPKYDHNPIVLKYENGVLVQFLYFFKPEHFDQVRDALKAKYPSLKCEASMVNNRMGAKFNQQECNLNSAGTMLSVTKFVSDIETSALTMMSSKKLTDEAEAKRRSAAKDL